MASAASSRYPRDTYALKQKAMKYYSENGIPLKMEEILNTMFYDDPSDVHGYLVNYFSQFTKEAVISRMSATQVYDSTGMPTIQTDAFCTVNNKEKKITSSTTPFPNIKAKPEEREKAEIETQHSVTAALKAINIEISEALKGLNPKQQSEIDKVLLSIIETMKAEETARKAQEDETVERASPVAPPEEKDKKKSAKTKVSQHKESLHFDEGKGGKASAPLVIIPDRPLEVFTAGSEAVSAVSQAVCACAATSNNIPIYRHVGNLARTKGALHEFRIPLPMVTIIQSGKSVPGKVNCVKEFMLVPGVTMPVEKSIEHIQHIYQYVAKSFATKLGPIAKFVNESGALCPQLETPTQALDLLQEAVNAQGLTIGEDMYLALNAAGHEFFDHDKGRYEVTTGNLKSPDDMVDFWGDIVLKYPALIAIIDPLRGEDLEPWVRLGERVSDGVFVIGDRFYSRPGLVLEAPPSSPIQTSGAVLYLEQMNSISDLVQCSNLFHGLSNEVVISTNQGDTTDTFIVDFAVGLGARFLKIGGPNRGERSCKLNRLVEISRELEPPLPAEESSAEEDENAGNEKIEDLKEVPKTEEEEALKIDIDVVTEEKSEKKEAENVVLEESGEEKDVRTVTWGENEKSRLKLHSPFVFPVIEVPAPPPDSDREGEEVKASSPSSKHGK
ncbi:enolase-like protein ENO4 [Elysia marginata]|uniref:Enolase 4 n=1 Tax=Elysia marginata TaxID=1093978 RepID=A0AAV4IC76_9GAST|nr:enolase-like protein ENO4 [Elysia marginata]